ncbi:hypothetical protein MNEG_12410 [Monoraphidium neglectum]|uniref:Uncharacterized protein n=1 Tax=Monoraphidium neglectum TaxID=145388 RepID=A0A0D2KIE1_9CHLO|nr:hypothetical protein MNEG_12410 [Monoraphidium neglectum]KIY95553.1 hypothetical protein MNEG_12410 [Monoraphidium neglectum]|eukprot:XP_013894573.1 hypothetical protein MNEG_12410 [Monoraphidium neglectum]
MFAEPAVAASPQLPREALPLDALQQQVDRLTATLGQPAQLPDEEALKAAAGAALQLAQQGAAGASDGLRGLLAPLALFGPEAGTTNVLFWVVMLLFCYNLLVLTPRQ